jgi:hypothetical protein
MPLSNLAYIKPTNKSKVVKSTQAILDAINEHFGKHANKQELKLLPSFILYVCCLVEEAYSSKHNVDNKKIDKKDEVLKIINQFLGVTLSEPDKQVISNIIEDLHSSNRIKKVSYLSKTFFYVFNLLLKKA